MAKDTDREEKTAKKRGSGPGFILGVMLGTLAGAAAATLFAPATGEELEQELAGQPLAGERPPAGLGFEAERPASMLTQAPEAHTPVNRVRAVLTRVRSRVNQAAEEGRQASQEAEEASRARYAELTQREGPFAQ